MTDPQPEQILNANEFKLVFEASAVVSEAPSQDGENE